MLNSQNHIHFHSPTVGTHQFTLSNTPIGVWSDWGWSEVEASVCYRGDVVEGRIFPESSMVLVWNGRRVDGPFPLKIGVLYLKMTVLLMNLGCIISVYLLTLTISWQQ